MAASMTIGVLGGMGSLAATDFLGALVRAFPGEKEWDRPRTVLDNACHMPSRVRALLYGEKRQELTSLMAEHLTGLIRLGCTDLVLCCNTSHVFLPEVLPLVKEKTQNAPFSLWHIIRLLGEDLKRAGVSQVSLIATEGTLDVGIYPQILSEYGVSVDWEGESAYSELRFLIEAVKQDQIDETALDRFITLVNRQPSSHVVLGCTEFPSLRARLGAREIRMQKCLHDPLLSTIAALRRRYQTMQEKK